MIRTSWVQHCPSDFIARMLKEADKDTTHNTKTVNRIAERCEWMGWALICEVLASLIWVTLIPIF